MKYKYFVSYSYTKGHGMIQIVLNKKIETYNTVLEIKDYLDKEVGSDVVILNWIPLEGDW